MNGRVIFRGFLTAMFLWVPFLIAQIFHAQVSLQSSQVLPPLPKKEVVKIFSLEFRPLLSDYYLIKAALLYGGYRPRLSPEEVKWMARVLELSVCLDPYYFEPYYMAGTVLPWEGEVKGAVEILKYGLDHGLSDWRIPFFLGFLHFHFLHNKVEGARYLSMAAERPGAPKYLPLLISRLYLKSRRTSAALLFLKGIYQSIPDERERKMLKMRIEALEGVERLERLAAIYRKRIGRYPEKVEDLVRAGLLRPREIPTDPYGGHFYFKADGSVWSTSNFRTRRGRS